jgi:LmbE family N-acetylglucosaminyl deacetylase
MRSRRWPASRILGHDPGPRALEDLLGGLTRSEARVRPKLRSDADSPLAVVSPHLDDAVLSCGQVLAAHPASTVISLFAGRPPSAHPPTEWEIASGFAPGTDAVGTRRREDAAALATLRAKPVWLPFCDSQYELVPPAPVAALMRRLSEALDGIARTVLFPLGLFHSDHFRTHDACALLSRQGAGRWICYQDGLYAHVPGISVQDRLEEVRGRLSLVPAVLPHDPGTEAKSRAIACYRSQIAALRTPGRPGLDSALEPERYWAVMG